MQLSEPVDPNTTPPESGGGGGLPVSDANGHVVIIVDDEQKMTSAADGSWFLQLNLRIVEGPSAGVEGCDRLNLNNQSAQAVEIARRRISTIAHAVGWLQPISVTNVLHNKPFRVVVGYQKGKEADGYTEIKKVLDVSGGKPGAGGGGAAMPAPTAPAAMVAPVQQFAPAPVAAGFPPPVAPAVQQFAPPVIENVPLAPQVAQVQQFAPAPAPPPVAPAVQQFAPPVQQPIDPNAAPWASQ